MFKQSDHQLINMKFGKHFLFASIIAIVLSVETFYIVLTGWNFGNIKAVEWIASSCIAFLAILFIYEPMRILVIASYTTFISKKTYGNRSEVDVDLPASSHATKLKDRCNRLCFMLRKSLYDPISRQDQEILRKKMKKERELEKMLSEMLLLAVFILMLMVLVSSIYHPLNFYSSQHIEDHLAKGPVSLDGIIDDKDLRFYLENSFLDTIHNGKDEKGRRLKDGNGWISEKFVRMLGVPRLRQLRVEMENCGSQFCVNEFSLSSQESHDFSVGWKPSSKPQKYEKKFNRIGGPWKFTSSSKHKAMPLVGVLSSYTGSGFASKLGRTANNSFTILEFLSNNSWIDRQTKAIFIDTTFYSVDSGLFNVVTLVLERSPFGNWIATFDVQTSNLLLNLSNLGVLLSLVLFVSLLLAFMFHTAMKIKNVSFFKSAWNVVDLIIIVFSIAFLVSTVLRNSHVEKLIDELKTSRNNEFVSFNIVAFHDNLTTGFVGFLISIATLRFWKILNFSRRFRALNLLLKHAVGSLMSITFLVFIFLEGFTSTVYIVNGTQSELFSTYWKTMTALMAHSLGFSRNIHREDLMHGGKILGVTIFGFLMFIFNILLLNVFSSIVLSYVAKVKQEMKKEPPSAVTVSLVIRKKFRKMLGWRPENELEFFHRDYNMERAHHIIITIDAHIEFIENYLQN